jgi:hypothetical protein
MNIHKRITAAIVLILLFGCSHVESYLDVTKDKGISKKYLDILNQWTKKETLYSQFETQVQISATYKSEAFNRAYLEEYARIYYLTDEEKKKREDMQSSFASGYKEFVYYAAMPQKEANDFDKSNSSWTVFLSDETGKRIEPLEIRKIEKITPVMEGFYPFINKYYGMFYSLKFPAAVSHVKPGKTQPQAMKLVFSSVLGRVELIWPLGSE